jgi:hypothetical protein
MRSLHYSRRHGVPFNSANLSWNVSESIALRGYEQPKFRLRLSKGQGVPGGSRHCGLPRHWHCGTGLEWNALKGSFTPIMVATLCTAIGLLTVLLVGPRASNAFSCDATSLSQCCRRRRPLFFLRVAFPRLVRLLGVRPISLLARIVLGVSRGSFSCSGFFSALMAPSMRTCLGR